MMEVNGLWFCANCYWALFDDLRPYYGDHCCYYSEDCECVCNGYDGEPATETLFGP